MKNYREQFEVIAEGKSYDVNVSAYKNGSDQDRFRVSVNEGAIAVFGWDQGLDRFAVMADKRNPSITPALEMIIAHKLEHISEMKMEKAA